MFHRKTTTTLAATAVAAALAVLASGPAAQAAALPLSSCGQAVGTSVILTKNLDCSSTGMFITAAGITIDLNGHVLKGDRVSGQNGIADFGGYDNLTIKNGVVRNFDIGILAQNADHLKVSNVVVSGDAQQGLNVTGTWASITSSRFFGNGSSGIQIIGEGASIASTTAAGNNLLGIWVKGDGASVKSTSVFGNASAGITLLSNSASVVSTKVFGNAGTGLAVQGDFGSVKSTTVGGNVGPGIFVSGDSAAITANRAEGNGFSGGLSDGSGLGIYVIGFTTAPAGTNDASGNDDPAECSPASLC